MLIRCTSPKDNNGDGLNMLKMNVLHRHIMVHSALHFYNVLFHALSCHMFCRILYKCICTHLCELCLKLYKSKTKNIYCFEEGVPSCLYNQSPTCAAQLGHYQGVYRSQIRNVYKANGPHTSSKQINI
jgi:hypothetical protein